MVISKQIKQAGIQEPLFSISPVAKPFLKWAGGKRQLIEKYKVLFPNELINGTIKNYYEPFVGGGAVFFHVAQSYNIENIFLYDINAELILTYKVIQKDVNQLINILLDYDDRYKRLDEVNKTKFYYETRELFNQQRFEINYKKYADNWIPRAAQIIFLNRTCFNGLFRFNLKGAFNSPAGRYKNPKIIDEQNLLSVSKLLSNAQLINGDFTSVKKDIKQNSFVYFDPPYRPISNSSNFTSYSRTKFHDREQIRLAKLFYELDKPTISLMLSNSDPQNTNPQDNFFDELYKNSNIVRVDAKRSINSVPNKRSAIKEILVTNYKVR